MTAGCPVQSQLQIDETVITEIAQKLQDETLINISATIKEEEIPIEKEEENIVPAQENSFGNFSLWKEAQDDKQNEEPVEQAAITFKSFDGNKREVPIAFSFGEPAFGTNTKESKNEPVTFAFGEPSFGTSAKASSPISFGTNAFANVSAFGDNSPSNSFTSTFGQQNAVFGSSFTSSKKNSS
jgi:hypothetical protein